MWQTILPLSPRGEETASRYEKLERHAVLGGFSGRFRNHRGGATAAL